MSELCERLPPERLKHATRFLEFIVELARGQHELSLPPSTIERWGQLLMLMREIDSQADNRETHSTILESLKDFSEFADSYPLLTDDYLPKERNEFIRLTKTLLDLGIRLSEAPTLEAYIKLRTDEACYTATFLELTSDDEVRVQPGFDDFMCSIERITIAANYIDTAMDAKSDFENGLLAFQLSSFNRFQLLAAALRELMPITKDLVDINVLRAISTMATGSLKSNRIKRQLGS